MHLHTLFNLKLSDNPVKVGKQVLLQGIKPSITLFEFLTPSLLVNIRSPLRILAAITPHLVCFPCITYLPLRAHDNGSLET